MIWGICATFIATLMPIIESREVLLSIVGAIFCRGRSKSSRSDTSDSTDPPVKAVDMPVGPGDDTAHKGPSQFHV